jgi:hypothetical protein
MSVSQQVALLPGSYASRVPRFRLNVAGINLSYTPTTIEAPLASREFERKFQSELLTVKALIKDVTLGSRAGPA